MLHTYMKILTIFGVLSGPVTGGGVCTCSCHSMWVTTTFPVEVVWKLLPWRCVEIVRNVNIMYSVSDLINSLHSYLINLPPPLSGLMSLSPPLPHPYLVNVPSPMSICTFPFWIWPCEASNALLIFCHGTQTTHNVRICR